MQSIYLVFSFLQKLLPHLLGSDLVVLLEDSVQAITLGAILKLEASGELVELLLIESAEVLGPLADHVLCEHDVAVETANAVAKRPDGCWVESAVRWVGDGVDDKLLEHILRVLDALGVCTPRVDGELILLEEEGFEALHVGRVETNVDHSLETDILIQPDAPADLLLVVDVELILEEQVSALVDLIRLLAIILPARVHRSEFAVPNREASLPHPCRLFQVTSSHTCLLLVRAHILLCRVGETIKVVVVDRVDAVGPALVKVTLKA